MTIPQRAIEADETAGAQAASALPSGRFRCPRCGGSLSETLTGLECAPCALRYPVREGIVDFRLARHDYYFNPVPRAEMHALIRDASLVAWDATVRRFLRFVRNVPDWIDNVAVNGRYAWKLFLDLPSDGRFLDFGCGLGNLTHNISPHVREVVALDLTWERLEFAQRRFARFNPGERITLVAGGDGPHLPFPDHHFDGIMLSGVLEWIGDDFDPAQLRGSRIGKAARMVASFFGRRNPRRVQLAFLRELRRVLKPGGQLFVGIENRWGYEYFTGRPDHHSGLRYGSLLPRFIANAYSIASRHRPYRTYTHSLPGARALFSGAGFARTRFVGLTPGYSKLREILPFDGGPLWRAIPANSAKQRIKRSRHCVPAFGIIADDGRARSTLLDRLLGDLKARVGSDAPFVFRDCLVSAKEKVILQGSLGGRDIVLKIPTDPAALAGERANAALLAQLSAQSQLAPLLPAPIAKGAFQNVAYFVESAVAGLPLARSIASMDRARVARMIEPVLEAMHSRIGEAVPLGVTDSCYRALVAEPVARLRSFGLDAAVAARLEAELGGGLAAGRWRLGLQHGDFSDNNVLIRDGRVAGVIDWEHALERGLPALDAIAYLESTERHVRNTDAGANLRRLARWDWSCAEELDVLRRLYARLGIDAQAHPLLCRLAWLHGIGLKLNGMDRFDPAFVDRWVQPMIAELCGDGPIAASAFDGAEARCSLER
jgi:SAM-dependent methyltransferase/aminoglycoside phosphotransferase